MSPELVRVGDVLELVRTPVEPRPLVDYVTIGVRSFGRGIFHYDPRLGKDLGRLRFFELTPNLLVISNIKGWEGAVAVTSDEDAGLLASNRFLTYRPRSNRIDVNWARWFFVSDTGRALIAYASPGSADRNRTLGIKRFENLRIALPDLEDQQRVASRLTSIADRVATAKSLAGRARHLARAISESAALRFDLTDARKADAGWVTRRMDDILSLSCDDVEVDDVATYDIAGVYSFGRGMFSRGPITGQDTSYRSLRRIHSGQLVMSRLKAWEGALAIVPDQLDGYYLSPEFPTFNPDYNKVERPVLEAVVTSSTFWEKLPGASRGIGARRERVSVDRLLAQEVQLAPSSTQRSASRVISELGRDVALRERMSSHLDALVPAAVNGHFAQG